MRSVAVLLRHLPRSLPVNARLCGLLHQLGLTWSTFKAIFFMKESILLTPILCFLYHTSDFGFSIMERERATVSHFFRSAGKTCFEELDWTTRTTSGQHLWLDGSLFLFQDRLAGSLLGFLQMSHTLCLGRPCSS